MMRMLPFAVGGKEKLQKRPQFLAICSVVSPLQMDQLRQKSRSSVLPIPWAKSLSIGGIFGMRLLKRTPMPLNDSRQV